MEDSVLRIRDAHRLQRKRSQRRERAWVSENQNITKARTRASSPMKTNPAVRGSLPDWGKGQVMETEYSRHRKEHFLRH